MNRLFQILLNYGKYYRIWPYVDANHKVTYVSVGLGRPFGKPLCKLLMSKDYGRSWDEIADFHSMDKRNTTTGQPFATTERVIFVPVWSASFYTHGETWFAIYKSEDYGSKWEKVFEDRTGTYGNHFFQNPADGSVYIGVGVGGGGSKGKIRYIPAKSYLLKSLDLGTTWRKVLEVDYPTALYSGTVLDDKMILVTARDKRSAFRSVDGGSSWSEIRIRKTTRNIFYSKNLNKLVITSDSSIFVSDDGSTWVRLDTPIKGLVLRYPTLYKGKLYMIGVGWRSYVISTDLNNWYMTFDVTNKTGSNSFARMAMVNDYAFLGNELNGVLLRAKLPIDDHKPISTPQFLKINLKYLISITKHKIKHVLKHDASTFQHNVMIAS